jgi:peptide/nickel transport system substrate-binding protein
MSRNRLMLVLGLVIAFSMVLAACGQTPAVVPTDAPTQAPVVRHGGWLDQIVFTVTSSDAAVTQISAGAIDVYAGGLASGEFPTIQEAGLNYAASNGLYYNMMYNPAVFKTEVGTLNPFSNRKIREATNWLYDRNYINQEVYAGGGLVKFFAIQTNGPDYADLADVARSLESKYAYNLEKAKTVISEEMLAMGATLGADGKWQYNGAPVTLILIIRNDSDGTRIPIGDYVGNQLEAAGFTVDRQYKKSREASPIWLGSDPADGLWHVYTAAWSSTAISRDDKGMFQQMYLNSSVQGSHPFLDNINPDPAFQQVGDDLANANFTNLEDRRAMMVQAMELSLQDSLQVWLIDGKNYAPYGTNVQVTGDLAAGIEGAQIYPYTVRFIDQEGGTLKWGEPDLFAMAWNPIAGSNWAFDQAAIRATSGGGYMWDPFTGLIWPLRAERAEVTMLTGLPVGKTLDWVTLSFADQIDVPADAWGDWDAATQTFIPVGEGKTAKVKSVVYYPADLFTTVRWHDGSAVSVGDFVMGMIMTFDRAKEASPIYDEQAVPNYESFMSVFKGVKIVSTDPLVIETYTDSYSQDAELNVSFWWPTYSYGESSWGILAVANAAEAAGTMAYSADKADVKGVEQANFIAGPTLDSLNTYLDQAIAETTIPYAPTMGAYVTADEAATRYANLKAWYLAHGNFWVGTGPYFLDRVYPVEKSLVLASYSDSPDASDRWNVFSEPKMAVVEISGPTQVKIGEAATFDVSVTFKGDPYPQAEIKMVKYLLYDATGTLVKADLATFVADGQYQVVLPAEITAALAAGANKLEIAVVPLTVSVPTFTSVQFVTAP